MNVCSSERTQQISRSGWLCSNSDTGLKNSHVTKGITTGDCIDTESLQQWLCCNYGWFVEGGWVSSSLQASKCVKTHTHTHTHTHTSFILAFRLQSVGEIWEEETAGKPFGRLESCAITTTITTTTAMDVCRVVSLYKLFSNWVVGKPKGSENPAGSADNEKLGAK